MSTDGFRIVLGAALDGARFPLAPALASIGDVACGPLTLLEWVETALDTRAPAVPAARRIAVMQTKLQRADGTARFWHGSLAADPWSTARAVLAMRDALVEAGWVWTSDPALPARLRDLYAAEIAGPGIPPGVADRFAAARRDLPSAEDLPWAEIRLVERRACLSPGPRRLLEALAERGVAIAETAAPEPAGGDLGVVQRALGGETGGVLAGDGSVVLLRSSTELMAAEIVAGWCAAQSEAARRETVFVLGGPTGWLDAALRRRGLPRFGLTAPSAMRAALQVLRLAFETRWAPFDPRAMLELLLLPGGPVPVAVARRLARALAEAPGRDGRIWAEALAECPAIRRQSLERRGLEGKALEAKLARDEARWRDWVMAPVLDPARGMPAQDVQGVCARVSAWAASRAGEGEAGALYRVAAAAARELGATAAETGLAFLPAPLIGRMIDEILGEGIADPAGAVEAAPWSHVTDPGAVWGEAERVVWWAPAIPAASAGDLWTEAERGVLAAFGCAPARERDRLAGAASGWRRPALQARRQLILVVPEPVGAEEAETHPLLHELKPLLDRAPAGIVVRAEEVARDRLPLAGCDIETAPIETLALPRPVRSWRLPAGTLARPETASASAIEGLLGCRLKHSFDRVAKLRVGARAEIPENHRLLGLLAHAVAEQVFPPGPPPAPKVARARAEILLESEIGARAAILRLPGHARDLAQAKDLIPAAIEDLARRIGEAGLDVQGTELVLEDAVMKTREGDVPLSGRIDLRLRDRLGRDFVLDLKWGKEKYRKEELQQGRAVQLATYVGALGRADASAAYYMLPTRRMLSAADWPFDAPGIAPVPLAQTWDVVREAWQAAVARLAAGEIDAPGIASDDDGEKPMLHGALEVPPPCRFCNHGRLCGASAVL